ncbi:MAG: hypothetical protein RLZZ76_753 [Candidatus Parcubacteria bacterium]|jgi:prepilin-type N-terminal cleavage/methylation domain-containing protein
MINHHLVSKLKQGFTLLETIIYLALFSILLTGVLISSYSFFRGAERMTLYVLQDNEAAFVIRKIGTQLNSASAITVPSSGAASSSIRFSTYDGSEHTFAAVDGSIAYATATGPFLPLNAERVKVSAFSATHTAPTSLSPRFLEYSFVIDGEVVGPIRTYFTF